MPQDMHKIETQVGHATPLKAARRHCLWCCNGSFNEVRLCLAKSCPLWPFRHGRRPDAEDRATVARRQLYPLERDLTGATSQGTALRAIRKRCSDCSGNSDVETRSCIFGPDHSAPCSLHSYRLGRNPNIKRSDEWKRAAAERLALARAVALQKNPIETPDLSGRQDTEAGLAIEGAAEKSPHAL
jgi:hypothetical protein